VTPPEASRPELDWAAVIALVCAAAFALAVLALAIGVAVNGGPIPEALATGLGILIGVALAYLGPRPPASRR
jgi:hypothetical protein